MEEKSHIGEIRDRIIALRMEMDGFRGKAAFAKRLGLSPSTYDNYENGRAVPVDVLVRIADVAGVDFRWLVTGQLPEEAVPANHPVIQRAAAMLSRYPRAAEPLAAFVELLSAAMAFPAKAEPPHSRDAGVLPARPEDVSPAQVPADQQHVPSRPVQRGRVGREARWQDVRETGKAKASSAVVSTVAELQDAFRELVSQSAVASYVIAHDVTNHDGAERPAPPPVGTLPPSLPISIVATSEAPSPSTESPDRPAWIPVLGRSAAGVASFWGPQDSTGVTRLADLVARHAGDVRHQLARVELTDAAAPADDLQFVRIVPGDGEEADVTEFIESPSLKTRYADAFALRIDGLSMHPDISHGDVVVVSPSAEAVNGKAAVVQLADQIGVTCKLWRRDGGQVHLIPVNDQMPPQTYPATSVVWAFRVLAKIKPA